MNTKTKLMLGLSALTAGTLAAGATGTFAWFTTNKTATATYSNVVAAATQGNISATMKGITDYAATSSVTDAASTMTSSKSYMSDVSSGDGIKFLKPDWVGTAGNSKAYNKISDVSSKAGYFTQYSVTIKNVGTTAIKLNLVGVKITTGGTTSIADWTRVAVLTGITESATEKANGFITAGTVAGIYQNSVTKNTNDKYITKDSDDAGTALDLSTVSKLYVAKDTLETKVELSDSLAKDNSITVGVSVWLEGTMNDDQDTAKDQSVSIALTFASEDVIA